MAIGHIYGDLAYVMLQYITNYSHISEDEAILNMSTSSVRGSDPYAFS
jgi:hypothetical protein